MKVYKWTLVYYHSDQEIEFFSNSRSLHVPLPKNTAPSSVLKEGTANLTLKRYLCLLCFSISPQKYKF